MGYEIEDEVIRRYLLIQLAEDERQQLEEKIMADNELFNRVLLAEDELVEEYLQGELPEIDRAEFEASFLSTPEGRQQVSLANALRKYVKEVPQSQKGPVPAQEEPIAKDQVEEVPVAKGPVSTEPVAKGPISAEPVRVGRVHRPVWWRPPALTPYFR